MLKKKPGSMYSDIPLSIDPMLRCFTVATNGTEYVIRKMSKKTYKINGVFEQVVNECDSVCHEGRDVSDIDRVEQNVVSKSLMTCDLSLVYFQEKSRNMVGFSSCVYGKDHLYIDILCSRREWKGVGRSIFAHMCKIALKNDKKAILLYATKGAKKAYWNWGFVDVKASVADTISFGMTDPRTLSLSDFQETGKVQRGGWMVYVL